MWSDGARLCQSALGWDTRAQQVPFPQPISLLAAGLLTGHMARDIWPCKLCRNGPSALSLKALTTFPAPAVFSSGLGLPPLLLLFKPILQAGRSSGSVKTEHNSWEPFSNSVGFGHDFKCNSSVWDCTTKQTHTSIAQMIPVRGCH